MRRFVLLIGVSMSVVSRSVLGLVVTPINAPTVLAHLQEHEARILSKDPLVYVIPNLLSPTECDAYIDYVEELQSLPHRAMTRSNPPEVSLDTSKLWPLPFLSILAGVPPLLKLDPSTTTMIHDLQYYVLPPIVIALGLSAGLAAAAVPLVRLLSDDSSRTSDAMALNQDSDVEFVRPLVERVATITQHDWSKWEAPVVTRYDKGAIFARHGDASPTKGSEWQDVGGQRVVTCICYLNTIEDGGGGETSFDRLGIQVKPTRGSALIFYPADSETLEADDRTAHESMPPLFSEKWIVQMFGRIGPRVPPPLGLLDSYGEHQHTAK